MSMTADGVLSQERADFWTDLVWPTIEAARRPPVSQPVTAASSAAMRSATTLPYNVSVARQPSPSRIAARGTTIIMMRDRMLVLEGMSRFMRCLLRGSP